MKNKTLIGVSLLLAAGMIISCGKSKSVEETTTVATAKPSTQKNQIIHIGSPKDRDKIAQNGLLSRGNGTVVYESYDNVNSVRYKMTLVTNSTGDVTLTRETTSGSTTTVTINGIEAGVTYTATTDSVYWTVPTTQKYFIIPFKPGETVWQSDGGTAMTIVCGCSSINCGLEGWISVDMVYWMLYCKGSACGPCNFMDRSTLLGSQNPAFVAPPGGFMVIEASSVTEP
jgi:hypothetical protein